MWVTCNAPGTTGGEPQKGNTMTANTTPAEAFDYSEWDAAEATYQEQAEASDLDHDDQDRAWDTCWHAEHLWDHVI